MAGFEPKTFRSKSSVKEPTPGLKVPCSNFTSTTLHISTSLACSSYSVKQVKFFRLILFLTEHVLVDENFACLDQLKTLFELRFRPHPPLGLDTGAQRSQMTG